MGLALCLLAFELQKGHKLGQSVGVAVYDVNCGLGLRLEKNILCSVATFIIERRTSVRLSLLTLIAFFFTILTFCARINDEVNTILFSYPRG